MTVTGTVGTSEGHRELRAIWRGEGEVERPKQIKRRVDDSTKRRHEEFDLIKKGVKIAKDNRNIQILAVIVAIISILVSVLAWHPWSSSPAPPRALVTLIQSQGNGIIPGAISSVSAPPTYPPHDANDHCHLWWKRWFPQEKAVPAPVDELIQVSAPLAADVTVTAVSVRILHSYRPKAVSYIHCTGSGPQLGTKLNVHLNQPNAVPTVVDNIGALVPLPPATINIDPGHTENIDIIPHGLDSLYNWSLKLTVVVNQHPETFVFGSMEHPLRSWLGVVPQVSYDYSFQNHSWQSTK